MKTSQYTQKPEPVLVQHQGRSIHVTIAAHAVPSGAEPELWQADINRFWVPEGELDLNALRENPAAWLHYVPLATRQAGKDRAQQMLDELRAGTPIVPVPSYRTGAAVCNRPADQVKLLGGLQLGGLSYYELASGEVVSLSEDDIKAIALDVTNAETRLQQAKQECWAAIDAATGQQDIEAALAGFETVLATYR